MGGWIAALDMGGTFVKGCVFDREIAPVTDFVSAPVNSQGGREEILDTVGDLLGRLCGGREISAVSISTPGPFDYRRGEAKMTAKYGGIYAVPLRPALRSRAGLREDIPVEFLSDANAFLLGEYFCGAGRGHENLAAITLGTGCGYSVMRGGRVLTNENGRPWDVPAMDACEGDTLDNVCSGRGLSLRYERITGEKKSAKQMAEDQDAVSLRLFEEMGALLGRHLRPRLKRLGVPLLVVGGQVSRALPLFEKSLSAALPGVEIAAAHRPADAALFGAVAYGMGCAKPWEVYADEKSR